MVYVHQIPFIFRFLIKLHINNNWIYEKRYIIRHQLFLDIFIPLRLLRLKFF